MPQPGATTRVVLAMIAAICVTLIANALDTSPTVSLVGATLAAAIPVLITAGGPHGIVLGVGVTAVALGVTYAGFFAADVVADRPPTFPGTADVREELGQTVTETGETVTGETETTPTTTAEEPAGDPEAGRALFTDNGCGGCHTFSAAGSSGTVGPNLDESSGGKDPEYIRRSIAEPNAEVAEGYETGVMPSYELSDEQVNDLIAFLTQS